MGNFCNCNPDGGDRADLERGSRRDGNMDYSGNGHDVDYTTDSCSSTACTPNLKLPPDYDSSNRRGRPQPDSKTRTKQHSGKQYGALPETPPSDTSEGSPSSSHKGMSPSKPRISHEGGTPSNHKSVSADHSIERPPHYSTRGHSTSGSSSSHNNHHHHPHDSRSSVDTLSSPYESGPTNIMIAARARSVDDSHHDSHRGGVPKHSQSVGPQYGMTTASPSTDDSVESSGREVEVLSDGSSPRSNPRDTRRSRPRPLMDPLVDDLHDHHGEDSDRYESERFDVSFQPSKFNNSPDGFRWSVPPRAPGHFAFSHSMPIDDLQPLHRSSMPSSSALQTKSYHFDLAANFDEMAQDITRISNSVPNSFKLGYHDLVRMIHPDVPPLNGPLDGPLEREDIPGALQQMIAIKTLDAPKQIIVILDVFLSDYQQYAERLNGSSYTAKYLFEHDIIGNLMYAWNMGVEKMNCTLIALTIMALCKFTHRNDFRVPFVAQEGIRLIGKTLSIPALKASTAGKTSPRSPPKKVTMLMSVTSMDSIEFPTFSFGHILAVLKITREICKEEVIDPSLWLSSGIHQKVLSTMKRDYDEPRITKACRNTLSALLDASYEIGATIINDEQIHDMIGSFLDSTSREHVHSRMASKKTLSNIDESFNSAHGAQMGPRQHRVASILSLRSHPTSNLSHPDSHYHDPFSPLTNPLFSRSTDTMNFSVGTPDVGLSRPEDAVDFKPPPRARHRKKKNLFELEHADKMRRNTDSVKEDSSHLEGGGNRSRTGTFTSRSEQEEDPHLVHRMLSSITDNEAMTDHSNGGDDEMSDDDVSAEGSVVKRQGTTFSDEEDSDGVESPRSMMSMPVPREVDREALASMAIIVTSDDPLTGDSTMGGSMQRISGSHSRFSVLSDGTDATNQTAVHRPGSTRSQSSTHSIMSLTEYDLIVDAVDEDGHSVDGKLRRNSRESVEVMADIAEEPSGSAIMGIIGGNLDGNFDDSDEEKSHTVKTSPMTVLGDAALHSLHGMGAVEARNIRLDPHQLLYINCLFHILYKIITLTRSAAPTTQRRPVSARTPNISFVERLKNGKRQRQSTVSGDTVGLLSTMDAAYMTNGGFTRQGGREGGGRISKLKNLNHGQNKLLEVFFHKRSFLNLFKVLKCYRLNALPMMPHGFAVDGFAVDQVDPYHQNMDDLDDQLGGGLDHGPFGSYGMSKGSSTSSSDGAADREEERMVSVVMLGCKILRKVLDYSQVITDRLLGDEELDIIGLLVALLFHNNMNIDLNIYILDILGRMIEMEDVRELLLSPEYFDQFLCALDPWWMRFINATKKMSESLRGDVLNRMERDTLSLEAPSTLDADASQRTPSVGDHEFIPDDEPFMAGPMMRVDRIMSTNSIGVVGTVDPRSSRAAVEGELHISVTIAMLKFFNELCKSNAQDMVDYGINERILVLLDFYLNVSLTHDKMEQNETHSFDDLEWTMDMVTNYKFVFSDKKHEECLMLCLECIQNLATDINMLLEFVVSKTCEKLSRICWSFRDNPGMIKTCCAVIAKLLKLEQSCEEVLAKKQDVLSPLVAVCKHIFKTAYFEHGPSLDYGGLIIAGTLYPEATRHREMEHHFMRETSPLPPSPMGGGIKRKASIKPQLSDIVEPYNVRDSDSQSESLLGNANKSRVSRELKDIEVEQELEMEEDSVPQNVEEKSVSLDHPEQPDHSDTPIMGPLEASHSKEDSLTLQRGLKLTMPLIQESAVHSKENSRNTMATPSPTSTGATAPLINSQSAPPVDHRVRWGKSPPDASFVSSPSAAFGGHLADLRDLFTVFIKISCVDAFCVEMVASDIMPILLECISNAELRLHQQPMTSLNFSDFMLSLTKNTKGRVELLHSARFDITLHISRAIGNNINNRGVVMKYLYALINLKAADRRLLRSQLMANGGMELLQQMQAPTTYKEAFSNSLRNLLRDEESEDDSDFVR